MKKEKKGLYVLLSIPFVLVGYGLYMFIYYIFFGGQVMTITMQMDILISIPWQLAIVVSLFMTVPIYFFHKRTKGVLIGYGEISFLIIMLIYGVYLWGLPLLLNRQGMEYEYSEKQTCMLFFEITMIITSILYKKEKEGKIIFRLFQIMKGFFCFIIGLAVYFSMCFIAAFTPWFSIVKNGVVIILSIYIFALLWLSKGKWNGKMLAFYVIYLLLWIGCLGGIRIINKEFINIHDVEWIVEMFSGYAVSILIGEVLFGVFHKRNKKKAADAN